MEKALNELMVRLAGKIPDADLTIVKEQVSIWLNDYELTKKTTALQVQADGLCKELQEYVVAKKIEGLSMKSLQLYVNTIRTLLYYTNKPVKEITTGDIRTFLYTLQKNNGVKDITLDNMRIHINTFYNWLVDSDYLEKNPCRNINPIKHEKNTRHALSAVQMERLRNACDNLRDKALIEVLYATACRVDELINIKLTDVDFDRKEVYLFGKGKKHRTSYLNARAVVALQNYLGSRTDDTPYLLVSRKKPYGKLSARGVEFTIQQLGKAAGIEKVSPHIIRHTTATDALNKGMPLEQIQKLLGHENISTTLVYAEVKNDLVKTGHQNFIV